MSISIEKVDQVAERVPYATYKEIKDALVEADGDVLEAIILLEEKYENMYQEKKRNRKKIFENIDGTRIKEILKNRKAKNKPDIDTDGIEDMIDSLEFEFDDEDRKKFEEAEEKFDYENVKEQIHNLLKKSATVRLRIEKEGKTLINIPIVAGVISVAFLPELSLIGLSAAVLTKYSIKIVNEDEEEVIDLGEFSEEKLEMLKDIISNAFSDKKDFPEKETKEEDIVDVDAEDIKESEKEDTEDTKDAEDDK